MRQVWTVLSREVLEGLRQPMLVATMAALFLVIAGTLLWMLSVFANITPDMDKALAFFLGRLGFALEAPTQTLTGLTAGMLQVMVFAQLLSMTAVLAGHAGLHDRQVGTLPFLLLAPIRRVELLAGKVLGAMVLPLGLYVLIGGLASIVAAQWPSVAAAVALPPDPTWLTGFLLTGPAWSLFIGTLCVLASSRARDVRTAQQVAWFIVFFAALIVAPLVVMLPSVGAQLVAAATGLMLTLFSLGLGSWRIGRDLSR